MDQFLSKCLCGFDQRNVFGALSKHLSKPIDSLSHELTMAKY